MKEKTHEEEEKEAEEEAKKKGIFDEGKNMWRGKEEGRKTE